MDSKFAIDIDGKKLKCFYITSTELDNDCIARLLASKSKVWGLDIETGKKAQFLNDTQAGLCPYRSFISLTQIYDGIDTVYMFDNFYIPISKLKPIFEHRMIAHNAIFDLQHLRHNNINPKQIDCSMLMYNLVKCAEFASGEEEDNDEGEGQAVDWLSKAERFGASLRVCVAKILGIRVEKELQSSNWTDRPLSKEQLMYAAKDAYFTYEVGSFLSKQINYFGLDRVYKLNRDALYPITSMILNGVEIDTEKHLAFCRQTEVERDLYKFQCLEHFGDVTNIRSSVQISNWLERNLPASVKQRWAKSAKTGKLKSDAKTLDLYKGKIPFILPLLEYKKLDKILSTYGISMLDKINPVTKRLHGSYTLGYTQTGRLSSRDPNIQNIPRTSSCRSIFRAAAGRILVGADYSQIELRVAAELSRDRNMLKAYKEGIDLHTFMASKITGKKLENVTKEERQLGKSLNFGLAFGLGAKGLVDYARWNYGVTLTQDEAYSHVKTFFDTYSGYENWQKEQRDIAARELTTTTVMGKLRKLHPDGMYTKSVNHPVQGSAAEIVIKSLNLIDKQVREKYNKIKMILCVHDEIILEVEKKGAEEAKKMLADNMLEAFKTSFPNGITNGLLEVKQGETWAETK